MSPGMVPKWESFVPPCPQGNYSVLWRGLVFLHDAAA